MSETLPAAPEAGHRTLRWAAFEVALMALAAADAVGTFLSDEDAPATPLYVTLAVLAVLALAARRRAPFLVFGLTVPALILPGSALASLIALFTVVHRRPFDWRVVCCAVTMFVGYTSFWHQGYRGVSSIITASYAVVYTAAPVWLGLLVRARAALSERLDQIERARLHEQELLVERALIQERSALAREMHDVVSHQVSLIAVQAGALQVTTSDEAAVTRARTIRNLAVRTLDELRDMVRVLRVSADGEPALAPQPRLADVEALVAGSGITTSVRRTVVADVQPSAAVQRAAYRAIQEGLTNVTKHAPGAVARLDLHVDADQVSVSLVNTAPTRPVDPLPSAQHGLLGLRERAELLGGSLRTESLTDGGYRLSMTLPANVQPSPYYDSATDDGSPTADVRGHRTG